MKYLSVVILVLLLTMGACGEENAALESTETFAEETSSSEVTAPTPEPAPSPLPSAYEHMPESMSYPQEDEPTLTAEENDETEENGETEENDENEENPENNEIEITEIEIIENETAIHAVVYEQARFTSFWAKTDTHFFFTPIFSNLYRVPLDDINQGEKVELPGEGDIKIVGIDEPYLFVTRQTRNGLEWRQRYYNTYRISISTLEATLTDSGMYVGMPFYHGASNSILFARADFDEGLAWLESLQLNTGIRNILYEFESDYFHFDPAWRQMENNAVLFNGGWDSPTLIFVDSELQARRLHREDMGWDIFNREINLTQEQEAQEPTPAEVFLSERRAWDHTRIGDWFYYLWSESWQFCESDLYRINVDGTQNELLRDEINYVRLYNFNDSLFATICSECDVESDACWYEAVKLAEDGSIAKILAGGWSGHNLFFAMTRLLNTDIIIIIQPMYYQLDYSVLGIYCIKTGAFFSASVR